MFTTPVLGIARCKKGAVPGRQELIQRGVNSSWYSAAEHMARKAEQLAQAREESIARALRRYASRPLDDWEMRYGGLQKWVEREQALPQLGGALPAEEIFALWIEAVRRQFPESDDFRRRLERFLADTQRQLTRDEAGKSMSVTVLGHGTDTANGGDASNVAGAVAGAIAASPALSGPSRALEVSTEASEG